MRFSIKVVSRILSLTVIMAAVSACTKKQEVKQAPPLPVVTIEAAMVDIPREQSIIATVKAMVEVDFVARVEGYLIERNFIEGQHVKKGDLLYVIEPYQYEAAVKDAEGGLSVSLANQKNAEIDMARQKDLVSRNAVSVRDYDNSVAKKLEADGSVFKAEAKLAQAKLNLTYTRIYAPFDGWIGLNKYDVGNLVGPAVGTLSTIVANDSVRAEFTPSSSDILAMTKGKSMKGGFPDIHVKLYFENGAEYSQTGTIQRWDNKIDPTTGTATIQAIFKNPDRQLVPGQFVTLSLLTVEKDSKLLIPRIALQTDQAGDFVWVVNGEGKAERRNVMTDKAYAKLLSVNQGIKAGDKVVVDRIQKLRPDAVVAATPTDRFKQTIANLAAGIPEKIEVERVLPGIVSKSDTGGEKISGTVKSDSETMRSQTEKGFQRPMENEDVVPNLMDGAADQKQPGKK